jgi:hypothetical protein
MKRLGERSTDDEGCVGACSTSSSTSQFGSDEIFSSVWHDESASYRLGRKDGWLDGYVYGSVDNRVSAVPLPFDSLHVLFNGVTSTSENT